MYGVLGDAEGDVADREHHRPPAVFCYERLGRHDDLAALLAETGLEAPDGE